VPVASSVRALRAHGGLDGRLERKAGVEFELDQLAVIGTGHVLNRLKVDESDQLSEETDKGQ
jgi:hypothetical protein